MIIFPLSFIDETPLMSAVSRGNIEVVEILIQKGANIKVVNKEKVLFTHL